MSAGAPRAVIVHYHLFKNGGTSIERMLQDALGDRWTAFDHASSGARIATRELEAFLAERPALRAVSSHQLVPPPPGDGFEVTPIVFLRDPLARVRSAWLFEWQKQPRLEAPKGTLAEYVRAKLDVSDVNVIANFQTSRLSHADPDNPRQAFGRHDQQALDRACRWLDALPFFGLVERFAESIDWMRPVMRQRFPDLELVEHRENVLQDPATTRHARIESLRAEIGDALFDELAVRNQLDLQLYAYAQGRFSCALDAVRAGAGTRAATDRAPGEGTGPLRRIVNLYQGARHG